jgi:hypothetical protein
MGEERTDDDHHLRVLPPEEVADVDAIKLLRVPVRRW